MPRPIPETVPEDIANIIRSNEEWGDLAGFGKAIGLERSAIYSMFLYGKFKPLEFLYNLGVATESTADQVYAILTIRDIDKRKAAFEKLYKDAGFSSISELTKSIKVCDDTVYKHLNDVRPSRYFFKYVVVGGSLDFSLHELAQKCIKN